ncbi:hypothetical protein T4A_14112 [Trichinella pseudospiralis]|uniref:Uncharacterized protein n=1 Tax=Trichinella pseudospiralis TaxID=6337 RepID=A0A0V1EB39_TRIPS|nr:hypothetical protein T4A_14112 [Trichinella pseudospiralis]
MNRQRSSPNHIVVVGDGETEVIPKRLTTYAQMARCGRCIARLSIETFGRTATRKVLIATLKQR